MARMNATSSLPHQFYVNLIFNYLISSAGRLTTTLGDFYSTAQQVQNALHVSIF
jgi:hypothetical protein